MLIYHVYSTHKQRNLYWCSLTSEVRKLGGGLIVAVALRLCDKLETLDSTRKLY